MDMLFARKLSLLCSAALLSGCIKILPDEAPPVPRFALSPEIIRSQGDPLRQTVAVAEPQAPLPLNGRKVMVTYGSATPRTTSAAHQEWEMRLPEMLGHALLRSLQLDGRLEGAASVAQGIDPDYTVISDLNDYQIIYGEPNTPPEIIISWHVKLVTMPERKIIASKEFMRRAHVSADQFSAILSTFNTQTAQILHDISAWVRHHMHNEAKK